MVGETRQEAKAEVSKSYLGIVLIVASLVQATSAFVMQGVPTLAPLFQPELGLSRAEVGLIMSFILAVHATTSIGGGRVVHRFGSRKTIPIGEIGMGLGMGALAWMSGLTSAIPALLVIGLGLAFMEPASVTAISTWFPAAIRGTVMSIHKSAVPLAGLLLAVSLPSLSLAIGWRNGFLILGALCIASAVFSYAFYRDREATVTERAADGPKEVSIGTLFSNPNVMVVNLYVAILASVQMSLVTFFMLYLRDQLALGVVLAGGYLAAMQGGGLVGRLGWGVISDVLFRGGRKASLTLIAVMAAVSFVLLAALPSSVPHWLLAFVAVALGLSIVGWHGVYTALVTEVAGSQNAATVVGITMTVAQGIRIVAVPAFGLLIDVTSSYRIAWLASALLTGAAAAALALLLHEELKA